MSEAFSLRNITEARHTVTRLSDVSGCTKLKSAHPSTCSQFTSWQSKSPTTIRKIGWLNVATTVAQGVTTSQAVATSGISDTAVFQDNWTIVSSAIDRKSTRLNSSHT